MEKLIEQLLKEIGENPKREGLKKTPSRVAEVYRFLTSGYNADIKKLVNDAIYSEEDNNMVILRDIEFFSMCEHHMLPFFGKCHIAYIPDGKILGLSKLPRVVDAYSRRLQVQERLTNQIANEINNLLNPKGVAVVMEAIHLCMMMRGVEKQNSKTVTSTVLGVFMKDQRTRAELMTLLSKNSTII